MSDCKYAYQYAGFPSDGSNQYFQVNYRRPKTELRNGVTDIKQVIGNQEEIVGRVSPFGFALEKPKDKYPAVPMK